MATDYIPSQESPLAAWVTNFSTLITAAPGAYGLMASDAAVIATAVNLFNAALTLALNPATKTKATVADKNAKKVAMLATVRQYSQVIKRNLGVSNEAKIALGLTINASGPSPIPAPTTQPVLQVVQAGSLRQTVNFSDITAPDRRAKPAGVKGLMLAVAVGTSPPASRELVPTYGMATRQAFAVEFDDGDAAKTAYYYGRWITAAGLLGPWSALAQTIIA